MKVLHVASFRGNIGDNANHAGFRPWFEGLAGRPVAWTEFEIRDVYRKTRAFDEAFAAQANAADLVVVGGGNYFELWVKDSPTGTSISIPEHILGAIRTPIFFNALGVDDAQGFTSDTLDRFRRFLRRLLTSDQFLVSVRNDGALAALRRHVGELPLDQVLHLPDGGFFAPYRAAAAAERPQIAVNLAGDMLDQRFPGEEAHTYQSFLKEMAGALEQLWRAHPSLRIVLFPHIFRDLTVYADLLTLMPDQLRRDQVRVAAYDSGPAAAAAAFGEYAASDAVLGMRFHANVVPLGLGVPTLGLYCYDQVARLYDELEAPRSVIDVRHPGFGDEIVSRLGTLLSRPESQRTMTDAIRKRVAGQRALAGTALAAWLARHALAAS